MKIFFYPFIFFIVFFKPPTFISFSSHHSNYSYDSSKIVEKVYLHTDRNFYSAGDDIWFKGYLIDASNRLLSNHSNNLHVELISPSSEIIITRVIRLDVGIGNGDFKLPENLSTGRYHIRAYTNYMRNFSDQLFFNKEITIINSTISKDILTDNIKYKESKLEIYFFPEGGSLIDDVSSVVAFKAVDGLGKGCSVSGEVFSSSGDFVTAFTSTHLGMGRFFLKPIPGLKYYAVVKNNVDQVIRKEIPKSFSNGISFGASINTDNELLITVKTNPQTLSLIYGNDLSLTISARKLNLKTVRFKIKSVTNHFVLPIDDIPDGIIMLTLSTLENLPISERLIFFQKEKDLKVNIDIPKLIYKQRDSVSLKISVIDDSASKRFTFLSLAAIENNLIDSSSLFPSTISSWFLIESDIRGPIEDPSYYFDSSNPNRLADLDLLLLTQGWRDFEWKYQITNYLPETGFTITGRVRKSFINKPLENAMVNIALFQDGYNFSTTVQTDSAGKYTLQGVDLTGKARLVISSINKDEHLRGLLIIDSVKYIPPMIPDSFATKKVLIKKTITSLIKEIEIKKSINKKYKLSDTIQLKELVIVGKKPIVLENINVVNIRAIYGKPDHEIIVTPQLENYQNAFELLNGMVAGVRVWRDFGTFPPEYKVYIRGVGSINSGSTALVLIDGVQKSYEELALMPTYFIDRIDILKNPSTTAMLGMSGANGAISIITKKNDSANYYRSVSHSANVNFSGYDAPRIFYSPKHNPDSKSAYKPDLRTTLYWEPNIILESNKDFFINYFNADNSSIIQIIAEGITTDGIPVCSKTSYEIK
ncbi:MAG: MG2 domain-containing protein [Tenuifilaceae bacterium]